MKKLPLVLAVLISTCSMSFAQQPAPIPPMRLTTQAFSDGAIIPIKYTQASPDGTVSPQLSWTNVPPGTQSFVLWMHDVDLALNKTSEDNLHWLVWNIKGEDTTLPEKIPAGAHLPGGLYQISYAGPSYRGPGAPATGPLHHYVFELFALDIKIDQMAGSTALATKTNIFTLMQAHILGKAAYVGLFHRPQ
jgi:Raf kinase inhibitor-like YbhB/YbcL family protein